MRPGLLQRALATMTMGLWLVSAAFAQTAIEPTDYRLDNYGAATPATLAGVPALTTNQAKDMWTSQGAVFIDVLPHVPRPAGLPADTLWRDKPHNSVKGAVWLPDVGRGRLAPETDSYFRRNLGDLTAHDLTRPVVIFCKRSCWMSWNAAKRAVSYGYTHVFWYSDGVDGWSDAALPMETVQPRT